MATRRRNSSAPTARTPGARRAPGAPPCPRSFIERYRGPLLGAIAAIVIVALGLIFVLKFGPSNQGREAASGAQPADPALVSALTQIPQSVYDTVGAGSAAGGPKAIAGAPALQQNGKPEVLYVGAEYCPYCAAERWSMIAALSRFGTFSNLHTVRSSTTDVFPGTPTFTFYGSSYDSPTIAFSSVEQYTNQPASGGGFTTLQSLSGEQQSIVDRYDRQPYAAGGIPFVDFGGTYAFSGATYNPGVLSGMDWSQIATQLANPSSAQAQGIVGSANVITATICQLTNQQPAGVCTSSGVQKASGLVGKS